MSYVKDLQDKVERIYIDYRVVRHSFHITKSKLKETKQCLKDTIRAQEICQLVAAAIQQKAHEKVSKVVTHCIEAVFEEPYTFRIIFERKRGRTQAKLVFERNGSVVDPVTASGGGVVDVASFALRLACLILTKPPLRRVLVLDEPFRFVSEEYQDRVASMLLQLAKKMKVQIIMVTHNQKYQVGKTVKL